jgi:uncharacterized protein YodC (DUF2158 family)
MANDIKPGDIVELKSGGGPQMTVARIEKLDDDTVAAICDYFVGNKFERRTFPVSSLKRVGV